MVLRASGLGLLLLCVTTASLLRPADALAAQQASRGQTTVIVTDSTGARIAAATVVATRGTERRTATADGSGVARFANLAAGTWTVSVNSEGFERWEQMVTVDGRALEVSAG